MEVEIASEDCSCNCERPINVSNNGSSYELVDYPDIVGCTYIISHDISRPSVIFLRKGSWRSLTKVIGNMASAKSQIALIAARFLTLGDLLLLNIYYSY